MAHKALKIRRINFGTFVDIRKHSATLNGQKNSHNGYNIKSIIWQPYDLGTEHMLLKQNV